LNEIQVISSYQYQVQTRQFQFKFHASVCMTIIINKGHVGKWMATVQFDSIRLLSIGIRQTCSGVTLHITSHLCKGNTSISRGARVAIKSKLLGVVGKKRDRARMIKTSSMTSWEAGEELDCMGGWCPVERRNGARGWYHNFGGDMNYSILMIKTMNESCKEEWPWDWLLSVW